MGNDAVVLTPQLIEKIKALLLADVDLPDELRQALTTSVEDVNVNVPDGGARTTEDETIDLEKPEEDVSATILIATIDELAAWADEAKGRLALTKSELDPADYTLIALLAGTHIYLPPSQQSRLLAAHPPDAPSPYLPKHLYAPVESFGTEYRYITKTLTTALNILFSIFGAAYAVYYASIHGAGYRRETGVLLGVLTGVVVGIADGVIVWGLTRRVEEGRKISEERMKKEARISGALPPAVVAPGKAEGDTKGELVQIHQGTSALETASKGVRLRRKAIRDGSEA